MDPHPYKPPGADSKLLQAAGLDARLPMTIASLQDFEPLGADRIRTVIAENRPKSQDHEKILEPPFSNGCIRDEENFTLTIDRTFLERHGSIKISGCSSFTITAPGQHIELPQNIKFFIEITGCRNFTVAGITCSSGRNIILIADSSSFTVRDCRCVQAEGCGVIIQNGQNFTVSGCRFDNILSAGILLVGRTSNGEVQDCTCTGSRGFFNHDAGIHLCHTSPDITSEQIPEKIHEPLPISSKTLRPHHIYIRRCTVADCRAQGIYLEGAVNCLLEENVLLNNNKEGICFDWGSSYNMFCRNIVSLNGERRKVSPAEIRVDFISDYPLLDDASSSMKLPGISLDNGCMNLIGENKIAGNYGGGIKMIRTALLNNMTNNQILYNTLGANEFVPYFHGITILGLGTINREFMRGKRHLLDFTPSILNSVTHNIIRETSRAIFTDKASADNFVSGNTVIEHGQRQSTMATTWCRANSWVKRFSVKLLHRFK